MLRKSPEISEPSAVAKKDEDKDSAKSGPREAFEASGSLAL